LYFESKKTLRGINQISKNSYSTHPKGGTMNREMDGQLTIRDETESTSIAVAGPDQVITLPRVVFC
jgi:hypothetical protein